MDFPQHVLGTREDSRSKNAEPWLSVLRRHTRLLIKSAIGGLIVALAISLVLPDRYKSTVRLMPPDSHSTAGITLVAALAGSGSTGIAGGSLALADPTAGGDVATDLFTRLSGSGLAGDLLAGPSAATLLVGILRSRVVQDDLINHFDLRTVYSCKTYEEARLELTDHANIRVDRTSGIISIEVIDTNRIRARDLATAHAEELNRVLSQLDTSAARRERIFLQQRVAEVNQNLASDSRELSGFSSRHAMLDPRDETSTVVESAAQLQGKLIAAGTELSGLEALYNDNNIRVRSLKARISELEQQLHNIGGGKHSADLSARWSPSIQEIPMLRVNYLDLYRRVRVDEVVLGLLTQQLEMAKIREAKDTPVVKVLDPASVAERKLFPPRKTIALTGMIVAVMLISVYLIFRREWEILEEGNPWKQLARAMSPSA